MPRTQPKPVRKTKPKSVDDYIAALPPGVRPILAEVRATIGKALPEAAEVISYAIPAYRGPYGLGIYFAAWRSHYAVYPLSDAMFAELAGDLAYHDVRGRTVRFSYDKPVPKRLITKLAKYRRAELTAKKRKGPP